MTGYARKAGRIAAALGEALREAVFLSGSRDVEDLGRRMRILEEGGPRR